MNLSKLPPLLIGLLIHVPAHAAALIPAPEFLQSRHAGSPLPQADRYGRRCQGYAMHRGIQPSRTLLWGTRQTWDDSQQSTDEWRSVLVSVDISSPRIGDVEVTGLQLEKGRLVASPRPTSSLVGTLLQGTSSDGTPVEVAICGAEPAPEDPDMIWYRVEAWNPVTQEWVNPCVASGRITDPRAMAVGGVWDSSGARQQIPGKLTLACENGAIAQCIRWGYKPWASFRGQPLTDLHQACTRMARADYCGNGRSHTPEEGVTIDIYDTLGLQLPTTQTSPGWDPARASFEAAWASDGAVCLSRIRDGQALDTIQRECPGRFVAGAALDLGQGDRCLLRRADVPGSATLKNRSYDVQYAVAPSSRRSTAGPHPSSTFSRSQQVMQTARQ